VAWKPTRNLLEAAAPASKRIIDTGTCHSFQPAWLWPLALRSLQGLFSFSVNLFFNDLKPLLNRRGFLIWK
jgi:hypothetical protein